MTTSTFSNKFDWVRAISDPNSGLTSTQHHVALALSGHLNTGGTGFVTQAQLALDIRMCERTVCEALTALADLNWIERTPGRMGYATTYTIAKKYGWVPSVTKVKAPKRKPRQPADPQGERKATDFIAGIYAETGVDPGLASADTAVARRLVGVMRRHLNSTAAGGSGLTTLRRSLVETSLASANNPPAVLLNRYKRALRMYPHLRPVADRGDTVSDVIAQIVRAQTTKVNIVSPQNVREW